MITKKILKAQNREDFRKNAKEMGKETSMKEDYGTKKIQKGECKNAMHTQINKAHTFISL